MRTFGSETEFGLYVVDDNGVELSCSTVDQKLGSEILDNRDFKTLYSEIGQTALAALGIIGNKKGFLSNGGRLYHDINTLEYATPERSSAEGVAISEISGELLVAAVLGKLKSLGHIGEFQLNKRSTDHARNSWGSHENISSSVNNLYSSKTRSNFLASHYLTRAIYTGAGGFVRNSRGNFRYVISPRLFSTRESVSTSRTGQAKPLLNTGYDSDFNGLRYQQANAEANNSPWSIKIRHASNSLVYTLAEHNLIPEELTISNPIAHTANMTMSLDMKIKVPLAESDGRIKLNPIAWQQALAEYAQNLASEFQFSSDELWAIEQILNVTDLLNRDRQAAASRVEWLKRRQYIEDKLGVSVEAVPTNPQALTRGLRLDFLWDAIGFGTAKRLRDKGWGWHGFSRQPTPDDLDRDWKIPPSDTRAALRANFVRQNPDGVQEWHIVTNENAESVKLHRHQTKLP